MSGTLAEKRRVVLVAAIAEELKKLDPILNDLSGVQITVKFYDNGRRVIVTHPELRDEST